ncbi:MAG: glycoside hydrolase family 95 protein, partial [Planctomycetes bacterium]|nr:glycoside hydrolase family 95 protein [Planctomycetota bacterium]
MLDTEQFEDIRQRYREANKQIAERVRPEVDDKDWKDYQIADGKVVRGGYQMKTEEWGVARHHLTLTKDQLAQLGTLRISPADMNGSVFVNGQEVGRLAGWQALENARFECDVNEFLKPGENVVAVVVHGYRRHGQLPLCVVLDPKENCQEYRRSLNLRDAVANVQFKRDGITFTREAFASAPDQVMAFRFAADRPGAISFTATLDRMERFETRAVGPAELLMTGQLASGAPGVDGLTYATRLRAIHRGGKVSGQGDTLRIESADEVVLLVAAATDYRGFAGRRTADPVQVTRADIATASAKSYAKLLSDHVADYHTYFNRVRISLDDGTDESREAATLPTDERLETFADGGSDPALAALYFNFGRYLLISSSRPSDMPANLQGIWAEGIQTPWNCDYHLDINVQMNYWPAEVCGLGDCHTPLFQLIASLQKPGAETARAYYNADGWVAHVITNVWGFTAPGEQAGWGATASGSAWLCDHLWEHYAYTRDRDFLAGAYPIMRGSA